MSTTPNDLETLEEHIESKYNGNKSECGRTYGVERNQVKQWLQAKKTVYVLKDGSLVTVIKEPI